MKIIWLFAYIILVCSCSQNTSEENLTALEKLKVGNQRFVTGYPIHPDETLRRIRELKRGQHPFAVVVSCSDSRIPPELIFDQGLGDIFTIRTAGNVIGDYELGSIEYAVEHFHCNLVIVLGHENCGAVEAFISSDFEKHQDHIQNIIDYIAGEDEEKAILDSIKTNPDLAIRANIKHGVVLLQKSEPILKTIVQTKQMKVIGAYYDLDTGEVTFDEN
jgi:carbonic anhydrase